MAGLEDSIDELKKFIYYQNDPNVNKQLRERIALQMMSNKKAYPKNIGEGLSAIGDSLGEIGTARRLGQADIAEQAAAKQLAAGALATDTPTTTTGSYAQASEADVPPSIPLPAAAAASAGPAFPSPPPQMGSFPATSLPSNTPAPTMRPTDAAAALASDASPLQSPMQSPPPAAGSLSPRDRIASAFAAPQTAPVVPQGNPTVGAPRGGPLDANAQMLPPEITGGRSQPPITPAPVPPQISPAPRPQAPQAGYITPEPAEVPQPQMPSMTKQEANIRRVMTANPNNTYLQQQLSGPLARLEEIRKAEYSRRVDDYKAQIQHRNTILSKREDQLHAAPKTALDMQLLQQNIAKGEEPTLREDVENKLAYDPITKTYRRPNIEGADPNARPTFKGTEFQGKALVNYGRARLGHDVLLSGDNEKVLAEGGAQAAVGATPFVGNALMSAKYRNAFIASENFVQAFVRQQSGGAFTNTELEKEARSMLPRVGDKPNELAQKRAQREQFIGGLSSIIGPNGVKAAEYDLKKHTDDKSVAQRKIDEEMAGVTPKGIGDTKVKKDAQGNVIARRVWDGRNWVEH